jgi:hypothetical protein
LAGGDVTHAGPGRDLVMLGLTVETRVFIRTGVTDLRLSFEGCVGWW